MAIQSPGRHKLVSRVMLLVLACVLFAGLIFVGDAIKDILGARESRQDSKYMQGMSEIDNKILARLEEWEQRDGQLFRFAELYRELLHIQSEAKSRIIVSNPSLAEGLVHDRLREGIPLLLLQDFSPDWDHVRRVFGKITVWAAKDSEASAEVKSLKNIAGKSSVLKEVVSTWYRGHSLTTIATARGIDDELLSSVVGAT